MKSKNISANIKGQVSSNSKGNKIQKVNMNINSNNKAKKKSPSPNNRYNNNNIKNINQINTNKNNIKTNKNNKISKNNNMNQIKSYNYSPNKNVQNIQYNNNYNKINLKNSNSNSANKNQSKSLNRVKNIKNISPPKNIPKLKDYQFIEFHPYTLKDYKELVRNPVVMGPLGPNVGTKEWEEKKNKMKKMMNYSNNVNKEHKGIKTLKKDTPKEEIEKKLKENFEKSARHRTYEYGKLLRNGKYKEEFEGKEKDANKLNKSNDNNNNLNSIQENNQENNQENEVNNNDEENNNINNNIMNYDDLIKQSEEFKSNIEDIREHILD